MLQTSGKMFLITGLVQEQIKNGFMVDNKWMKNYNKNLDLWLVNLVYKLFKKSSAVSFSEKVRVDTDLLWGGGGFP